MELAEVHNAFVSEADLDAALTLSTHIGQLIHGHANGTNVLALASVMSVLTADMTDQQATIVLGVFAMIAMDHRDALHEALEEDKNENNNISESHN